MGSAQDYSPAEMLQFGQRAEAERDFDYALRAYAYVMEQYAGTVESQMAGEGYRRVETALAGTRPSAPSGGQHRATDASTHPPASQATGAHGVGHDPRLSQRLSGLGPVAGSGGPGGVRAGDGRPPAAGNTTGGSRLKVGEGSSRQPTSGPAAGQVARGAVGAHPQTPSVGTLKPLPDQPTQLPRVVARHGDEGVGDLDDFDRGLVSLRRYRVGGFIAGLFSLVGWLLLIAGLALVPVTLAELAPMMAAGGIYLPLFGLELAVAAICAGIVLIFIGQLGRAVFDNADANLQLLAIERAKVGY